MSQRRVPVGKITGVFGVRGAVKIFSYTDPRTNIFDYSPWYLVTPAGERRLVVRRGRPQGNSIVAELDGVSDRDAAAALIGADIQVGRVALGDPPPGEYFWSDLEGLEVRAPDGEVLGVVDHLLATGSNDVLVVEGKIRRLIPFIYGSVILSVDLENRVIVADWQPD